MANLEERNSKNRGGRRVKTSGRKKAAIRAGSTAVRTKEIERKLQLIQKYKLKKKDLVWMLKNINLSRKNR